MVTDAPLGVNVVGYLDAPLGIGEVARSAADALARAGVCVTEITVASDVGTQRRDARPPEVAYPVNLVCINPDGLPGAEAQLGRAFFAERYTIGYWWWEVDAFPARWERGFDLVDEVWTGSRFVADTFAPAAPVPVLRMPVPVAPPEPSHDGADLPDGFKFLTVYDYRSVPARKNPLGAIEAFRRAFGGSGEASLVLKSVGKEERPAEHARVEARAREAGNVHVIDGVLSPAEVAGLIATCDAYVSLHRAEGFGLPLATALHAGKPVIATGYGGPMDFLTPRNSYCVGYRLVPIGDGNEPYPADGRWAEPDVDEAAAHMRRVVEEPGDAGERAATGRQDVERLFSPEHAGAAMAARLARVTLGRTPTGEASSAVSELVQVIDMELEPRPGRRGAAARGALRRVLYRLLRPYTTHRREVDAELIRALRALEGRIDGLERSLAALKGIHTDKAED